MGLTSVHDLDLVNRGGHSDSSQIAYTVQGIYICEDNNKKPSVQYKQIQTCLRISGTSMSRSMSDEKLPILYVDLLTYLNIIL
jgi:hypothetical protein